MADITDMEQYRKKIEGSVESFDMELTEENLREAHDIAEAISAKYISRLNATDHTFSIQTDENQAAVIQAAINGLRIDLNNIIVDLVGELVEKTIEVHFLRKNC